LNKRLEEIKSRQCAVAKDFQKRKRGLQAVDWAKYNLSFWMVTGFAGFCLFHLFEYALL